MRIAGLFAAPTFVDIDNDGDLDAFIGSATGDIRFFQNNQSILGTPAAPVDPVFALSPDAIPFGLTNSGSYSTPTFIDIEGDGDMDAFIGNNNGTVSFYRNAQITAGSPDLAVATFAAPISNPFGLANVSADSAITFADINHDGKVDAFIGDKNGDTWFFPNIINTPPSLSGITTVTNTTDKTTAKPFLNFTITDIDLGAVASATISLDVAAKGVFTAASLAASGFQTADNGLTYTHTDLSTAALQSAIRALVYQPTANRVAVNTPETTTFTVSINDGRATTTDSTTTVVSTSINDAPVLGSAVPNQAVNDNVTLTPFTLFTISDADNPGQTQTITTVTLDAAAKGSLSSSVGGTYNFGTGIYTFNGIAADAQTAVRSLVFTPTANRVAVATTEITRLTVSVFDAIATAVTNNTTTVVSTSINDIPVLGNATASTTINDNQTAKPFSTFTVVDVDFPAQIQTVTVALDVANKGKLFSSNGGTYDTGTGKYSFSGTAAAQTAIQNLVFTPTINHVAVGSNEITNFTVTVNDGKSADVINTVTNVTSVSINDAPVLNPIPATMVANYLDTPRVDSFPDFVGLLNGSDVDFGTSLKYGIEGITDNGTGFVSISNIYGTLTVNTLIGSYTFAPTPNKDTIIEPLKTDVNFAFTMTVSDGLATPVSRAITVNIKQSGVTESIGDDTLLGTPNPDTWAGLAGNDVYYVNNINDVIIEKPGEGWDVASSTVSYTLGDYVEGLALTGIADINATGNTLDNNLVGNVGNNSLDGKSGADTMQGSFGNDTYYVDNIGDVVLENAGEGMDVVWTSLSTYTLGANIEVLGLLIGAVNHTGNDTNNYILGNDANNSIDGKLGSDVIYGGLGDDTLDGGVSDSYNPGTIDTLNGDAGNDTFLSRGFYGAGVYDGGAGTDLLDFSQSDAYTTGRRSAEGAGVSVNLAANKASTYYLSATAFT